MRLTLSRCIVRSWDPRDAPSIARHANNRQVWLNLRDRFPHPYSGRDAAQFIARTRRQVRRVVSTWTGIYQYTIDQVLEDMIARSRELKLRLAVPESQAQQDLTVMLTVQTMNHLQSGGHRLFL